ncbi:MAG: 7TM-DISM domain-containing protein [Chitinophagales bacterium]
MLRVLYIICFICCLSPFGAAGNTIQIDAAFRRTEIYNALTAQEPDTLPYLQLDFNLKNVTTTERTVYLSIINPTIDSIEVKTKNKIEILGDHINFKQHKIKHNNHVAVVSIAANSTEPVTLKIKKQWKYTNIRVMLSSQKCIY